MAGTSASATIRERLALHVLQAGAVAVALAASPYKLFDLDRYFVPKELVLHVCAVVAALLLLVAAVRATLGAVDILIVVLLAANIASAGFATNVWVAERAVAISLSGALLFWSAGALRRAGLAGPLLAALVLAVAIGAATSLAQAYGVTSEYFSLNRAPGGTFGNRNFVAHLCAIGMPVVALVALTGRNAFVRLLGAMAMALVAAALVLSRSRAAWLAAIIVVVVCGVLALMTRKQWSDARISRRLIGLGMVASAGAAFAVVFPNHLEWKSDSPYLESAAGLVNYKEGSGHGRLVQYTNSLRLTESRPILGVGPGNWAVAYPKVAVHNDPSMSQDEGTTSNPWPSSDWVAYLSERGIVGFAAVVLAIVGIGLRAVSVLRVGVRDSGRTLAAVAAVGVLVATVVVGAFDAVLLVAVPTFFFWTIVGALVPSGESGVNVGRGTIGLSRLLVVIFGAVMIVRSAAQLASIAIFSTNTKLGAMERASTLDPGGYRIHVKLAEAYLGRGDCTHARSHARAAQGLFPNAAEPRRILSQCGR